MFQTSSSAIQRYNTNSIFSPKDSVSDSLKSRVVYKFICAGCGVRYIGETYKHLNTCIDEQVF